MKTKYKVLLSILILEIMIASILDANNVELKSWIGNAIATFIFFTPIEIWFYLLGRDKSLSERKRHFFKIAFWFIIVCYLFGGVALIFNI